jgi:hypothetical protein
MERDNPPFAALPPAAWRAAALRLRDAAQHERRMATRQTMLVLATDCETLAEEREASAQQPGKPKPPGNPPRPPDRERAPPIEEPPQPVPPPWPDPPPPPLSTRGNR